MVDVKLSLRDWFAGQALGALIARGHGSDVGEGPAHQAHRFARRAYAYADLMMHERENSLPKETRTGRSRTISHQDPMLAEDFPVR